MKTMLNVLVTVAFIAVTKVYADIKDFSEEVMKRLSKIDPQSPKYSSYLINSGIRIPFQERMPPGDGISLLPDALPDVPLQNQRTICRNFLGINVVDQEIYCNISFLGLWVDIVENVDTAEGEDSLNFALEMISDVTTPFRLTIPVFKLPSELTTATDEELQRWATENQVGLVAPLEYQQFREIQLTNRVTLQFDWLVEHIKLGIFKTTSTGAFDPEEGQAAYHEYVMRPIVLRPEKVKLMLEYIDIFSYDEGSWSSSNISELNGLADLNI